MKPDSEHLIPPKRKSGILTRVLVIIFTCTALYFAIFHRLAVPELAIWDEAEAGINAIEMYDGHNVLVPYFKGSPDLWSLKPPLLPWLQALSFKVFGYNTLGLRMPSALASLGICFLFLILCTQLFKRPGYAAVSSLIFASTAGFFREHVARYGDYDALLSFCITGYMVFFFLYIWQDRRKYLYLAAFFVFLAIMAKGSAGLLGLAPLLLYMLLKKKLRLIFARKAFYYCLGAGIALLAFVYGAREHYSHGYLKAVWHGEFLGTPFNVVQGHEGSFTFYFDYFLHEGFKYFLPVLVITAFYYWAQRKVFTLQRELLNYVLIFAAILLLVLSCMTTKIPWYDAPVYPLLALPLGIFLCDLSDSLLTKANISDPSKRTGITALLTALLIAAPYLSILGENMHPKQYTWDVQKYGPYLNTLEKVKPGIRSFRLLTFGTEGQAVFYQEAYAKKGYHVHHPTDFSGLAPGDTIITCEHLVSDSIAKLFKYTVLDESDWCHTWRLEARLKSDTAQRANTK